MEIRITDNTALFKEEFEAACLRGLEKCGLTAEGYAKKNCTVDTGNLRNSITHKVAPSELAGYVGTNVEYGAYVELGTGIHYPGGRQTPWLYTDDEGETHFTRGQKAQPYLKPAVTEHKETYQGIFQNELES